MAHFAKLDENNVVVFVTVGRDEDDEAELTARTSDVYKQTSYNTIGGVHLLGGTPFRKNFAGIGYTYNAVRDAFIPPQPYQSWVLDDATCQWKAPIAMPIDGQKYIWNEITKSWDLIADLTTSQISAL